MVRGRRAGDVSGLEREIDELVYALYALTPDEIALVEGAPNSSHVVVALQMAGIKCDRITSVTHD